MAEFSNFVRSPVIVLWNYGHWCNMHCLHCYTRPSAEESSVDMTTQDAEKIAKQLIEAEVLHVHFGGGEPLGRKDFLSIAKMLTCAGITVTLSTNGSLLSEKIADRLSSLPIAMVAFSIHGTDVVSHDSFNRFSGAWEKLVLAISRTVTRGIRTKLVMTITRPVAPHAAGLLDLAQCWNVNMVQYQTFKPYGNASLNRAVLTMSADEWRSTYRNIEERLTSLKKRGGFGVEVNLGIDNDPELALQLGMQSKLTQCNCGIYSVTIRPNGDVSPCGLSNHMIGNLHQASLREIWQHSPFLMSVRKTGISPCRE